MATNLKQKVVKINENHQDMLNTFTKKWGFMSESEVFRQALLHFYRKMEPEYLKPSVQQKQKQEKLEEEARLSSMTETEWVTSVLKGLILKGHRRNDPETPEIYCVTFGLANTLKVIELKHARDYFTTKGIHSMEHHLNEILSKDIAQAVKDSLYRVDLEPFGLFAVTTPENTNEIEEPERIIAEETSDGERVDEEDTESLV